MTNKSTAGAGSVQTTFTKQKRELAKALELISTIRAQEKIIERYSPDGKLQTQERAAYVVDAPEAIAKQVFDVAREVARQHGARQRANSANTGRFEFAGATVDLTVPQLRALKEATSVLENLVESLPVENRRVVPNTVFDGRPAFATPMEEHVVKKTRVVPYEEKESTRVRTYEEPYDVVEYQTRAITVDYGLAEKKIALLKTMVGDLATAIQVAIDDANAKSREDDPALNDAIAKIVEAFASVLDAK